MSVFIIFISRLTAVTVSCWIRRGVCRPHKTWKTCLDVDFKTHLSFTSLLSRVTFLLDIVTFTGSNDVFFATTTACLDLHDKLFTFQWPTLLKPSTFCLVNPTRSRSFVFLVENPRWRNVAMWNWFETLAPNSGKRWKRHSGAANLCSVTIFCRLEPLL